MLNDSLQILLVEDSLEDADLLQEFLDSTAQTSWKITLAEKLKCGLEQLHHHHFDVVLSDLSLPDAYGLEAITQLHAAFPNIPIVVLSSLKDEAAALEAVRQGAQDYLVKGQINAYTLIRSIRYAVERARMQQVVQQQSVAIATSTEGIAILNGQWDYTYLNEAYAKIYGYDASSMLLHTSWNAHYAPAEQARLNDRVEQSLRQQGFWRGDAAGRTGQGHPFAQELSITSLPDGGMVCILRDISDRKQAEAAMQESLQQARELHRLKADFITMVSHEFRTPLSVILAATEALKRYALQWPPDKVQLRYDRIMNGVQQMTTLLDDLLFMNRADDAQLVHNPVPLNLEDFCQALVTTLSTSQHPIRFSSQGNSRRSCLDPALLHPLLTHLLSNAIKYSPDGGKVRFDLVCTTAQVTFSIRDDGIGIPLNDQDKLFLPFYRGGNVGNISGIGMGLTIVKQCVEQCRGGVHVTSQVNQGTLVTVVLPIASAQQIHDQDPCS